MMPAIGLWGLATLHIQVSLASRVGSHDGLTPQKVALTQGLVSAAFGEKGHCAGLAFPTRVFLRQPILGTLALKLAPCVLPIHCRRPGGAPVLL